MGTNTNTYEARIQDIFLSLKGEVPLNQLREYCLDSQVSDFKELEKELFACEETGNVERIDEIIHEILGEINDQDSES